MAIVNLGLFKSVMNIFPKISWEYVMISIEFGSLLPNICNLSETTLSVCYQLKKKKRLKVKQN